MKKTTLIIASFLMVSSTLVAQVAVNSDNSAPDPSAMLDVKSTTKGLLVPRMTLAELSAISNPSNGLQVFCTTDSKIYIFVAPFNTWKEVAYGVGTIEPPFSCGNPITDYRNSKSYNTVQIGDQCWFKENLNIGIRINSQSDQTNNGVLEKYCYNDLESNCDIYGGIYQWNEMMQFTNGVQGICPSGWHIPADIEWTSLSTYLGGETVAGGKMKSTGTLQAGTGLWQAPNTGATNESGFTGLPAGYFYTGMNRQFQQQGQYTSWWSSSEYGGSGSVFANTRFVVLDNSSISTQARNKLDGYSVRCLRNL